MTSKEPINPRRIRKVPGQLGWLDHRLISGHHIERCSLALPITHKYSLRSILHNLTS
jgi:SH3-like domain-containing protein